MTDNGADSCWATTRLGANGYRCCSRDALRDNSAENTSPAFFASRTSSCQTTFSVSSDAEAAASSEPPASVGLACRPVGAWRRHLVKRIHCKTYNPQARQPFDVPVDLNSPQNVDAPSRLVEMIPRITTKATDCGSAR